MVILFNPDCVIALVAPEACLKSDKVKEFIETRLKGNIVLLLKSKELSYSSIEVFAGRVLIRSTEAKNIIKALKKCFGIHALFAAQEVKFETLKDLCKQVVPLCSAVTNGTFAVRGKSFSFDFKSRQLNETLGGALLEAHPKLKVNLDSPKHEVHCLAFKNKAYIYFESVPGASGMPVGSQGKAVLLCKVGKKSFPAKDCSALAWLLMRSGLKVFVVGVKSGAFAKLSEWNSGKTLTEISFEQAKGFYSEGEVFAFFSPAKKLGEAEGVSKSLELGGAKAFAPCLFFAEKTPFN